MEAEVPHDSICGKLRHGHGWLLLLDAGLVLPLGCQGQEGEPKALPGLLLPPGHCVLGSQVGRRIKRALDAGHFSLSRDRPL